MIKSRLVRRIAARFFRIETVKVKSVRKLSCKEDVYNINVDVNHNYCVADGMVVKNCDALRYGCEDLSKFGVQV